MSRPTPPSIAYGVSTSILSAAPLEQVLQRLAGAGIGQIEISAEPPHFTPGAADVEVVRDWLDQTGLRAPVGHALYGSVNLSALDESVRRQSVQDVRTSLQMMTALGTFLAVVHPTGFSPDYHDDNRGDFLNQACTSMNELAAIAGDLGIRLAWENLPHHGAPRPLHDMTELRAIVDRMPEHVGLCLDTTHALYAGHDPLTQLKIAGERLFCLHLHDSDGSGDSHWVPGRGTIDWEALICYLDEIAFVGPRTIEAIASPGEEDRVIAQVSQLVRERFSPASLAGVLP